MSYYRPQPRPSPAALLMLVLCGLAVGVFLERYGLLPGSGPATPADARASFGSFWEAWRLVERFYVDREAVRPQHMTEGAIRGMLASLGDVGHTTFLSPDEYKEMQTALEGKLEGIGARMTVRKNQPTVVETLPDSPARAAGLRPGDVLLEVNGKSVVGMPLDRIVLMVRGPAGTTVRLRVLHAGATKDHDPPLIAATCLGLIAYPLAENAVVATAALLPQALDIEDLVITRAKVEVAVVAWCMVPGHPVAHVAIREFGTNADAQLRDAIEAARQQDAKGLIVDVRGNPGGLKKQAVAVTSEFLKAGEVFIEQDAEGHRKPVPVEPGGVAPEIPLVVLIDEGSASSAEIFAGAIQDHERGKLVGTKTFGTGTVLYPFPLRDGGAVLLAVEEWLTPKGRVIWHKGITPDVEAKLPDQARVLFPEEEARLSPAELARSDDRQFLTALEVLQKQLRIP